MLLLGDQGPHCYLSSTTFFSLVRIPYVMRTTIHNRRGTNHLIDPRFRSERLQLQSDNVNTFIKFLIKVLHLIMPRILFNGDWVLPHLTMGVGIMRFREDFCYGLHNS